MPSVEITNAFRSPCFLDQVYSRTTYSTNDFPDQCLLRTDGLSQRGGHFRMYIAALIGNARALENLVGHIDLQVALVHNQAKKCCQVARIELAGMTGNGCRQVQWSRDGHAVVVDGLARLRERA